ncbi:hypothetical protein QCD60_07980 [Pokkaliibacter sp. MBI-7]|uniref:hypothetical protein n=1 Tax=Pokkaliibacter sp. MBI-7 TaxID=3040600 RepID=UPI0024485E09|nr:hypothetical protein [Pokkaliibacter sp. MBI-7]MDH2432501.1 hypothetical protein [Pokkaliibacter sp. MBI-7]
MMIRTTLIASAIATLAMLYQSSAQAEDLEFTLINNTSVNMTSFHVSPGTSKHWQDDLLEGDVLRSGEQGTVTIQDGLTTCEYDIRAEFADGDVMEEYGLDLCELGSYTFHE